MFVTSVLQKFRQKTPKTLLCRSGFCRPCFLFFACLNTSLMSSVSLLLHIHSGHAHAWKGERARSAASSANRRLSQVVWAAGVSALSSCVASAIMYSRENATTRCRSAHTVSASEISAPDEMLDQCIPFIILSAPHSFIVVYSVSSLITIDLVFITFITQTLLSSYCKLLPKRPNHLSIYSAVIMCARYSCVHIQGVNILSVRDIGPSLNIKRASAQQTKHLNADGSLATG